jgi:hypothetical protein
MNLRLRDLFSSEPPSPEQRRALEARHARQRAQGRTIGEAANDARLLEDYVDRLGAELGGLSDDDPRGPEMTRLFHEASNEARLAEQRWQEMRTGRAVNATR